MIKMFFKSVRFILGGIIVLVDKLLPPRSAARTAEQQQAIDGSAKTLALYQFASCPFCIKVRRHSKRLSLPLATRDVLENEQWHNELETQGGKRKVPCLRIEDQADSIEWLYESDAIKTYLDQRVSQCI